MKFSALLIAAVALVSVNAELPGDVGAVKGVPLTSLRSATFTKGEALSHNRNENLASSHLAVPDGSNPYKSQSAGVALSATNGSESSSSSTSAVPFAVAGCAVAAVGIAGFVFMKKRKQQQTTEDESDPAETPATGSPSNDRVDFNNDMETPVAV